MKKNGRRIFKRKSFKIITPDQKEAKKSNKYLDVKYKRRLIFNNKENLHFF